MSRLKTSCPQPHEPSLPAELEERFEFFRGFSPDWGDEGSVPPTQKTLDLFRTTLLRLQETGKMETYPEIHVLYDGSIEFVFPHLDLYGSINEAELEFEWVGHRTTRSLGQFQSDSLSCESICQHFLQSITQATMLFNADDQ